MHISHDYFLSSLAHINFYQGGSGVCVPGVRSSALLAAYITRAKFIRADCTLDFPSSCPPVALSANQSIYPSAISTCSTPVPLSITTFQLSCSPRLAQISFAANIRKKCCNEGICIQWREGFFCNVEGLISATRPDLSHGGPSTANTPVALFSSLLHQHSHVKIFTIHVKGSTQLCEKVILLVLKGQSSSVKILNQFT